MADGPRTRTPISRLLGYASWALIVAFLALKALRLAQGSPLTHELDFSDLSPLAMAAAVAAMVLIFRSPRVLRSTTMIETHEVRTVVLSFLFVFVLMAAYYVLRPVRDAMASDWSNTEISVLWNIQLVLSTFVVALYGWTCSRVRFTLLVPIVYVFFAVTFVAFYFGSALTPDRVLIDKAFYVWVTLFSLMHMSVFWSFMADVYSKEQSRRLFSFIATGASAGASLGPLLAGQVVQHIGADNLILVASAMLLVPIPIALALQRLKSVDLHNENVHADVGSRSIGGSSLAGFKAFFTNPYLLAIGLFILLYTTISSFTYFEQVDLLRSYSREDRTAILATLSAIVNALTFGLGIFATSRIVTRLGMTVTLALVPVLICAGLLMLAFAPILTVLLALQVVRQGGNFGITRPAREMLFTHVDRETRFKSKPVIDVVVYRGGDALSSIGFASLTDGLGLGVGAMAGVGAAIAAVWAAAGIYLGGVFKRHSAAAMEHEPQRAALTPQQQAAS
ncbi:MAG TPA: MFS transporter [Gammaproteobacteria bacterium]|jgi:AAA family ATP:ADP antiporter|nr:MFS transporter [Gammaproteobacteria bacterium]